MCAQPEITIAHIDDLTTASDALDVLHQDGMSLECPPRLHARRVIVRMPSVTVVYHSASVRVRTRTSTQPGLLGYVVFGPRVAGSVEGVAVRPGMLVAAGLGAEAGFFVEPAWEDVCLLVRPQVVLEHQSALGHDVRHSRPGHTEILCTKPVLTRRLFGLGKRLVTSAVKNPSMLSAGSASAQAEIDLLEGLMSAMRSTSVADPSGVERTHRTYSRIVTLAEDYVVSHAGEGVRVSDLCRVAEVSERTLECAFKEVTGLTPLAYLIRMRLHRVHATLQAAEPGSTLVSREALKWGFWHFGEFSRAYKQCFGESPSDTLRHEPGAGGLSSNTVARR